MFTMLKKRYDAYKKYKTTMTELSNLTDRELSDIGISRCDIPHVALKRNWP